jgi:hypothetical protein
MLGNTIRLLLEAVAGRADLKLCLHARRRLRRSLFACRRRGRGGGRRRLGFGRRLRRRGFLLRRGEGHARLLGFRQHVAQNALDDLRIAQRRQAERVAHLRILGGGEFG